MAKSKATNPVDQKGGITHKKDINAGSGAFNQGTQQDPDYDKGTKVTDEEKHAQETPVASKKKKNPDTENSGQNNDGRYQ